MRDTLICFQCLVWQISTTSTANVRSSRLLVGQRARCSGRSARIRSGKSAIVGWRDVLAPALREANPLTLWPFVGRLNDLLMPGNIAIAETYPAESYRWFFPAPVKGKGELEVRMKAGDHLLKWPKSARVELDNALASTIDEGFPAGDDAFDAVVGLFGMIEVVMGRRQPGSLRTIKSER